MPGEHATFLASVRALLSPGDALLLGTDLVKDESVLVAAYDDAAGVTVALCRSFVLSVVRAAVLTLTVWRVLVAAGIAASVGELQPLTCTDMATTEERHS